ncbi:MAG: hypothetical protein ACRDMA_01730 [Solirubrobacterales bacterium]
MRRVRAPTAVVEMSDKEPARDQLLRERLDPDGVRAAGGEGALPMTPNLHPYITASTEVHE